ncbi:MAG: patatin-like phospholipase family protein [Oligoflexia bacterium]|nr:patatin-like phospholipase family protein [Oligoflexia bacterium]
MKRRPQDKAGPAISVKKPSLQSAGDIGIVLSGGGARAAYQVGALRALMPFLAKSSDPISVIIGSSIGAINGLVLAACIKEGLPTAVEQLDAMWRERTFRNTFAGSPSGAFFRAVKMAFLQYLAPGPHPTGAAIFDPTPLMQRVDRVIQEFGGLSPDQRDAKVRAVAVMTTMEGKERKPLIFMSSHKKLEQHIMEGASFDICYVDSLHAKHGFASAALPSVLPPVELDTDHGKVRFVDGGISQNVPVDPAVRMGAERVVILDISGRHWWLDRYGEAHDTRPTWEVPAGEKTFCLRPPDTFVVRNMKAFGPILKEAVKESSGKFINAVGPVWPVFTLLKKKLGEEVAYEVMSYVALDADYLGAIIELGYNETMSLLRNMRSLEFHKNESFTEIAKAL